MPLATSRQIGSTSARSEKRTVARPTSASPSRAIQARSTTPITSREVPGAVGVEERRAAVQPAEIDMRLLEREHLVVALAGPGIAPAHRGAGRPDQLDGAPLGVDALRHQPDVGPGLQRQIDACAG